MRKSTKYEIKEIIRKEWMIQAAMIVESTAFEYMENNKIDLNAFRISHDISNISFEVYVDYKESCYEIAHYHYEDCMWVITNQDKVYKYIDDAFKRVFEMIKHNVTIDERN